MSASVTSVLEQANAAFDEVQHARVVAMTRPPSVGRCLELAELADVEAAWWAALFEQAKVRAHWRAALVAREHALAAARLWRRRALTQQLSEEPAPQVLPDLAGVGQR